MCIFQCLSRSRGGSLLGMAQASGAGGAANGGKAQVGMSKSFFFDTRSRGPEPTADGPENNDAQAAEANAVWLCWLLYGLGLWLCLSPLGFRWSSVCLCVKWIANFMRDTSERVLATSHSIFSLARYSTLCKGVCVACI